MSNYGLITGALVNDDDSIQAIPEYSCTHSRKRGAWARRFANQLIDDSPNVQTQKAMGEISTKTKKRIVSKTLIL